ncbi:MAG: exo-alpha-sialidase [Nanoarchaeota archaeon]
MFKRILAVFLLFILVASCANNETTSDAGASQETNNMQEPYKEYVDISQQGQQPTNNQNQQATSDNQDSDEMDTSDDSKNEDSADLDTGGTTVEVVSSEFTLADGAEEGPGEHGPWDMRLTLATSDDSTTWEKTGLVLADQADVPSLVYGSDGTLFLYYVTWAKEVTNKIVVAVSEDNGESWAFKKVDLPTQSGWSSIVDPAVVLLDDGTLRMYATLDKGEGDGPGTHSFISDDGINFEIEDGVRFDAKNPVLDPNIILIDNTWHLYAGGEGSKNYHATSSDGLEFEQEDTISLDSIMFSNGIAVDGGARYYGFEFAVDDAIYSMFSEDGSDWEVEKAVLELEESDVETRAIKDSSVIQLKNKSYLMVYVTGIPE